MYKKLISWISEYVYGERRSTFIMGREIRVEDGKLKVVFQILENGVVELKQFDPANTADVKEWERGADDYFPITEVQITGMSSRGMHGCKHNAGGGATDFVYQNHEITENPKGKELVIYTATNYGVKGEYHMRFFNDSAAVQVWTVLKNEGTEAIGLEYVSSFIYHGLSQNGEKPYFEKTNVYTPHNSWDCESQWRKNNCSEINLGGLIMDGFNTPGFGINRYTYGAHSSWSSCEYLPMGICEDTECNTTWFFQVEHSGQWLAEYGSSMGKRLYAALSGATELEHGWWKNLEPGDSFASIPVGFGVAAGGMNEAMAELTAYRRKIRRPNKDDEKLNVVFNDYMNCLMADPTEEKEKAIIDKAAELGCEYYCLDAGWYDKGFWWDRVGEWKESPERFPNTLKAVCDYAKEKGMIMGLWLEIEVMGVACELANQLPDDWFICRHGKRHIDNKRYLLDFRNPDVRKYCMDVVDRLINDYGVGYFKVDYNVTMGLGSDLYSDSCADAIREHYLCLYEWYQEIFRKHPDLVIENCGSGGQRMDYGMLKILSLQSTSDQTDYIYNSYIAANVASAVAPEQAGMWVYPYEDNREHVIYNMVNGLLLRPYLSGMVWKMGKESMDLMREGVSLYKAIREDVKNGVPVFPLGFTGIRDEVLAYAVKRDEKTYLAVFTPKTDHAEIPLTQAGICGKEVKVLYPATGDCNYEIVDGNLKVTMPQTACARLFEIK